MMDAQESDPGQKGREYYMYFAWRQDDAGPRKLATVVIFQGLILGDVQFGSAEMRSGESGASLA